MAAVAAFVSTGGTAPVLASAPPRRGITLYWDTWDGKRYNLSDPSGGVYIIGEGLEGLGYPKIATYETRSPQVHGSSYDGWLATDRKVFWNVGIYHEGGEQAWVDRARAFLRSFRPGTTGRWIARMPNGQEFGLTLRYKAGLDGVYLEDPSLRGWYIYQVELAPEQVFWEGPEEMFYWETGLDVDFYGPTGFAPDFYISSSQKMTDAKVTNRGDVEAYATWELRGPFPSASFGLAGRTTNVPFELRDGQVLTVDTDPRSGLTALLDGVDVMERLPGFQYPAIPAGMEVPVSVSMGGAGGNIRARFRPLYLSVV